MASSQLPNGNRHAAWIFVLLLSFLLGTWLSPNLLQLFYGKVPSGQFSNAIFALWGGISKNPHIFNKLLLSTLLGYGLPLLIGGVLLWRSHRSDDRHASIHGNARFAKVKEIAAHGLFTGSPQSLVLGRIGHQYIQYPGQQFAIVAAPTRSGKGVGIVIPNLLNYHESLVCLDIKGENHKLTSGYRAEKMGQTIIYFNPYHDDHRSHRWNPLSYVRRAPDKRAADLLSIATMFYPLTGGENDHFQSMAQYAFVALAGYVLETKAHQQALAKAAQEENKALANAPPPLTYLGTIGEVLRLASGDVSQLSTESDNHLLEYFMELARAPYLSPSIQAAFGTLLGQNAKEFGSTMATFKGKLKPWLEGSVDAATSGNDFNLLHVRQKRMTIYVVIPPHKLAESQIITNLFFTQLIQQNTQQLPEDNPLLKYQCLLLLDEFTSLGKVDIIAKAVSYMAGYNLRLFPIIQSMAQLASVYGKDDAKTMLTNHAVQIIYAPRELADAEEYSKLLGNTTVVRESSTLNRDSDSRTYSEEARPLMLPQELMNLDKNHEIIRIEGFPHPIRCQKILYYQEAVFKTRLLPAVPLPKAVVVQDRVGMIREQQTQHKLETALSQMELDVAHFMNQAMALTSSVENSSNE